ncbi:VanZ family protein [Epilithonimonas tenax]|uniref:VanZ family protein n=1 Tax=Epilithonimonas tenax TaxID=191577 RepID=UPI0006864C0F|nr:VanZ family protein [Epilithonimonas tenax]
MKKLLYKYYPPFINVYTVWLLYLLFFISFRNSDSSHFSIKPIPFDTIDEYFIVITYSKIDFFKNIIGNIFLFSPYGFLGILYPKLKKVGWFILTFFVIINIVEFSQFYFKRGFADVDDVILNTTGALVGYFIYRTLFYIKDR